MVDERDVKMVQIVTKASREWRELGGEVIDTGDGMKFCFGGDDGPCVEVSDSTIRKVGRWLLAIVRVLGRKLGLGV